MRLGDPCYHASMAHNDSETCHRKASEARGAAEHKGGGQESRIAGHLALAWDALAKAKARREQGLPKSKH